MNPTRNTSYNMFNPKNPNSDQIAHLCKPKVPIISGCVRFYLPKQLVINTKVYDLKLVCKPQVPFISG